MLLRRYKRNDELDLTEEQEQLEEQGVSQANPGEKKDLPDDSPEGKTVAELREEAKSRGLEGYSTLKKDELIALLKGE